jgi:hypothetical protein
MNLNVCACGRFLCLCLRASCFGNFTLVVRIMNEIGNSFNVILSDRKFKQEFGLVRQEISTALAVVVVVMRERKP